MNYNQIKKDFQKMTDETQKLVDKYNKSVQSIKNQENAISKVKSKLEAIKNGSVVPSSLKELDTQLKQNEKELDKVLNKIKEIQSHKFITTADDKELANLNQAKIDLTQINSEIKTEMKTTRESSNEVEDLNFKLEELNSKLQNNKENAAKLKEEITNSMNHKSVNIFGNQISKVGDKIDRFKSRMTRLIGGVAIFNMLRNSLTSLRNGFVSILKSNNEFSSSLNQIKANLMTAFAPIYNACLPAINVLMNALSKITGTIAMFVANLFGTSLKDATKDAKKLSGALNKTASSAKKASGSLSSIDTLEVISSPSSSNSASSAKSGSTIDYSGEITYSEKLLNIMNRIKDFVVDSYEYAKKHKALVAGIAILMGTIFAVAKISHFVESFKPITGILKTISKLFITVGEDGTKSFNKVGTGSTIAVAGLLLMVGSISKLVTNWDDLDAKQKIIKVGMAALGAAAIALGYAIATGISAATLGIGAVIALIATLLTTIAAITIKFFTEKDAILSTKDAQEQLNQAQEDYINANEGYINAVDNADNAMKKLEDAEKKTGLSGEALNKAVENGTLKYSDMNNSQKEVYKAYLNNKKAQDELTAATDTLSEAKKAEIDASWKNQLAIAAEKGNYDEYKKAVVDAYNRGELSAEDARDKIEQAMSRMSDASQETFMEDLPNNLKEGMDPDKYQTMGQKFKNWWKTNVIDGLGNAFKTFFTKTIPDKLTEFGNTLKKFFTKTVPNIVISAVEGVINSIISMFEGMMNLPIKAINKIIKTANKIPGVEIGKFTEVNLGRVSMPRLAKGAVIPPRQEFAAILGDQKHGTNIEAPLDTIKQANREVLAEFLEKIGINGQDREIVLKNWQFILQFGNENFGKMAVEEIKKYEKETSTQFLLA